MATKTKWAIDPNHSSAQFKVKHLMISTITGAFKTFTGELKSETDDFNNAEISFEIETNSISTNQEERDTHLRSPLFLNTEKFPKITFIGTLYKKTGTHELQGDLTICGVTKKIVMAVEFTGIGNGRFNNTRAGFEVNGKINRKDFGLNFSLLTESGSMVVGEDIKLHFDMQLIKQAI